MTRSQGKTAFVTGAGGGLGAALVTRLSEAGWSVFAADLSEELLAQHQFGENVVPITVDVTDTGSVEHAAQSVSGSTGGLDAVINFAGVMGLGSLTDIPEERLRRILDINVMGTYRINKAFLPLLLQSKGRIVNITSETAWQTPAPLNGPYAMSKFAVQAYSHALRRELSLFEIKVITIQPGPFKTRMTKGIDAAMDQALTETERFAPVIRKFKHLAAKQSDSAHDPDVLARVIERALTVKRPKAMYSVKPDPFRSSLERLPLAVADRVWLKILQSAGKG